MFLVNGVRLQSTQRSRAAHVGWSSNPSQMLGFLKVFAAPCNKKAPQLQTNPHGKCQNRFVFAGDTRTSVCLRPKTAWWFYRESSPTGHIVLHSRGTHWQHSENLPGAAGRRFWFPPKFFARRPEHRLKLPAIWS